MFAASVVAGFVICSSLSTFIVVICQVGCRGELRGATSLIRNSLKRFEVLFGTEYFIFEDHKGLSKQRARLL